MKRNQFINLFTDFVKKAIMLNKKRLEHDIQSLENEVEDLDDEDFKMGLRLIIDGYDPKILDEILSNKISFEKDKYTRIYKTIVKRTVLGIHEGLNNRILFFVLLSMAGLSPKEERKIELEILRD
jgi:flagellar motor component MotA